MTIYFAGAGIGDFVERETHLGGATTTAGAYFVKECVYLDGDRPKVEVPFYLKGVPDLDNSWVSLHWWTDNDRYDDDYIFFAVGDIEGNWLYRIRGDLYENVYIDVYEDGGYKQVYEFDYVTRNSMVNKRLDFHMDKTNRKLTVYLNRRFLVEHTSDTTQNYPSFQKIYMGTFGSVDYSDAEITSLMIADEDTTIYTMVQMEIETFGSFNDFTGELDAVNQFGVTGDDSSIEGTKIGDQVSFKFTDKTNLINGGDVRALVISSRMNQDNSGADAFNFFTYKGEYSTPVEGEDPVLTEYREDSGLNTLTAYITPYKGVFDFAPDGGKFKMSTLPNYEFGIQLKENG